MNSGIKVFFQFVVAMFVSFSYATGQGQPWSQAQKLVTSDKGDDDQCGESIVMEGNELFVACRYNDFDAQGQNFKNNTGAVYYFQKSPAGDWVEVQKIVPNNRYDNNSFGYRIAFVDGIFYATIKDNRDSLGNPSNTYYNVLCVFEKDSAGLWQEVQRVRLFSPTGEPMPFQDFAVQDSILMLADFTYKYDSLGQNPTIGSSGAVFTYKKRNSLWVRDGIITARFRQPGGEFSSAVALDLPYLLIGHSGDSYGINAGDTLISAGSVSLYKLEAGKSWVHKQKILANDRTILDDFGSSLEVFYPYLAIYARFATVINPQYPNDSSFGAIYLYDFVPGADSVYQVKKPYPEYVLNDGFMNKISFSRHQMAVGIGTSYDANNQNYEAAAGAVLILNRLPGGGWDDGIKLVANDRFRYDAFGSDVALEDSILVVGALGEDSQNDSVKQFIHFKDGGSSYVFRTCDYLNDTSALICHGDSLYIGPNSYGQSGFYTIVDSSSTCQNRLFLNLAVTEPIDLSLTYINGALAVAADSAVYHWIDCQNNVVVDSISGKSFMPLHNGDYAVAVLKEGCWDTSACFVVNDVSLEERVSSHIAVFPNPTSGRLHIRLDQPKAKTQVLLSTATGRKVMNDYYESTQEIELEILAPAGVYFLTISSLGEESSVFRILKK